jgi:hypothetical protein
MIQTQTSMGLLIPIRTRTNMGLFKDYNRLFDLISELDPEIKFEASNWRFNFYSAKRVASSYKQMEKNNIAVGPNHKQAYEQNLGLLENCTGNWMDPQYIAVTSNAHLYDLKKKWCIAYCAFHNLDFTVTVEEETDALRMACDE